MLRGSDTVWIRITWWHEVIPPHEIQALHWERGRPARNERAARARRRELNFWTDRRTLQCSGERDFRAPSEELERTNLSLSCELLESFPLNLM